MPCRLLRQPRRYLMGKGRHLVTEFHKTSNHCPRGVNTYKHYLQTTSYYSISVAHADVIDVSIPGIAAENRYLVTSLAYDNPTAVIMITVPCCAALCITHWDSSCMRIG